MIKPKTSFIASLVLIVLCTATAVLMWFIDTKWKWPAFGLNILAVVVNVFTARSAWATMHKRTMWPNLKGKA